MNPEFHESSKQLLLHCNYKSGNVDDVPHVRIGMFISMGSTDWHSQLIDNLKLTLNFGVHIRFRKISCTHFEFENGFRNLYMSGD